MDSFRSGQAPRGGTRYLRPALLCTVASLPLAWLSATPALADCGPPASSVQCDGFDADGFSSAGQSVGLTVNAGGTVEVGISINGPGSSSVTNNGTIDGSISADGNADFTIVQNGALNGGAITVTNGTGTNSLTVTAGHSVNAVEMHGAVNIVVMDGSTNSVVTLEATGINTITNGGQISGAVAMTGTINTIVNNGHLTSALTMSGSVRDVVRNNAGATIDGTLAGDGGKDVIYNAGTINGGVVLGDGDDELTNEGPGTIQGVDMGAGDDVIRVTGGTINGEVVAGVGNDMVYVSGGLLSTGLSMDTGGGSGSDGDDYLEWSGGNITSHVRMEGGDDQAVFIGLRQDTGENNLGNYMEINGGDGDDWLEWKNTRAGDVARFTNWEHFDLLDGSILTFSNYSTLTLGDAGTGTGELTIDSTSKVLAGGGTHTVSPFDTSQLVSVQNAGTIDLTNDTGSQDRFVVLGAYVGTDGRINLQTYLGTDGSPSDQLVIRGAGASGSGTTALYVTNLKGPGDQTTGDGIRVIDAQDGATTTASAFHLGSPVGAGIFEYALFRGGVTASEENDDDWFLRSEVPSPPPPPPPPSPPPPGPPPPSPPPSPIPNVRPEIPGYVVVPGLVRELGLAEISTFHKRQGDQKLITVNGQQIGLWARLYGYKTELGSNVKISGLDFDLASRFDGHIWGLQVGQDLWARQSESGSEDRAGLFYSHSAASGDVYGNTLARFNALSSRLSLNGDGAGAYWTHVGAGGWYTDFVGLVSWLHGDSGSDRGIGADLNGVSSAASLETGVPFQLSKNWSLEPQAQIILQHLSLDKTNDRFTDIHYDTPIVFTGRLGMRLEGNFDIEGMPLQPYLDVNLWHALDSTQTSTFLGRDITFDAGRSSVEVGGGLSAQLSAAFGAYVQASYLVDVSGPDQDAYGLNAGLRYAW